MTNPAEIPRYGADASLALLRKGYAFIPDTCDRLGSDAFRTRIMGRDVICMRGPAAAALAYGGPVTRVGAMPGFVLRLLQGKGSVQQLNGDAHRHRKAMFIALAADPARVKALTPISMRLGMRRYRAGRIAGGSCCWTSCRAC